MSEPVHRSEHLVAYALEHPWALTPGMLLIVADVIARHLAGKQTDPEVVASALVARDTRGQRAQGTNSSRGGGIALVPVYGVIAPRMNLLSEMSGGTTFEQLTGQVRAAVADPAIKTIVFDVDSPGGNAAGATEFAKEVRDAAGKKRIVAVANHMMASAAYWAMSGASELVASPSSLVGSIGVYTIHDDISAALEQLGVKRSVFSAGKYKAEGVDGGALSPDAKAHIQGLVNSAFGRFVADVARGRRVPVQTVRDGMGQGRVLDADTALHAGLIDRIATVDEVLAAFDPAVVRAALDAPRAALARAELVMKRAALDAAKRPHRVQ